MKKSIAKNKVIEFPKSQPFHEFLDELKKAYDENRLKDFICIYDYDYKKGQEKPGFHNGIDHYWFGDESTLRLLGLLDLMRDEILEYMKSKCRESNEE